MQKVFQLFQRPEVLILLLAFFLRIWAIDIKPPHFDEGINGWFVDRMQTTGFYNYDPKNYHGPWYFYVLFLSLNLFGRELFALRLPAIIGSVLCVAGILGFRKIIGEQAARIAGLLLAISPAATFYGRYSIHESWFTCFVILFYLGILGMWILKERNYLFLLVIGLTGMLLTKETALIHIGCAVLAAPTYFVWNRLLKTIKLDIPKNKKKTPTWKRQDIIISACLSIVAITLFYSGFLLNPQGVLDFFMGKAFWVETGIEKSGHSKPWFYWFQLMARYEWPMLLGVAAGTYYAFWKDKGLRFLAIAAFGVIVAYSIISYKTPWCILPIQWPFFIFVAAFLAQFNKHKLLWVPIIIAAVHSIYTSYRLNLYEFDNEKEPYVYVQTFRDINQAIVPLISAAKLNPTIYNWSGVIAIDSYYPLPWMFGQFGRIAYNNIFTETNSGYEIPDTVDFLIIYKHEREKYQESAQDRFTEVPFRLRGSQAECLILLNMRHSNIY